MPATSRRTVLTGIGVINPVGSNTAAFWEAIRGGKSGIRPIQAFDASNLPTRIAGEVPGFDPKNYIPKESREARKRLNTMARGIHFAVCAAQVALDDGKVDKAKLDPTRFGVEF